MRLDWLPNWRGTVASLMSGAETSRAHPREEARIAARWWAGWLRDPESVEHDAGDLHVNAVVSWAREQDSRNDGFDAVLVDEFEERLAERIDEKFEERTWDPGEPYKGMTVIKCDYDADPLLWKSASDVGLEISSKTTFPIKTTMWINPCEIRIRTGYGAEVQTLWESGEWLEAIRARVSDWTWTTEHPERGFEYEPEPKVFPTEAGYIVRAYGGYDVDMYGPTYRNFYLPTADIEREGLGAVLNRLESDVAEWQAASESGGA